MFWDLAGARLLRLLVSILPTCPWANLARAKLYISASSFLIRHLSKSVEHAECLSEELQAAQGGFKEGRFVQITALEL